jgi:hypothetical protein
MNLEELRSLYDLSDCIAVVTGGAGVVIPIDGGFAAFRRCVTRRAGSSRSTQSEPAPTSSLR